MSAKPATTIINVHGPRAPVGARAVTLALMLMTAMHTAVAESQHDENFGDKDKTWQEAAVDLPAAPKEENLARFFVSATATQSFAIDVQSISVGADGVVRYTLAATSAAGARSVSYEGIRCATNEKKLYAFGQADGTWSRARRDQWDRISNNAANRQHAALAREYFCLGTTVAGSAGEIARRLREQKPLTP